MSKAKTSRQEPSGGAKAIALQGEARLNVTLPIRVHQRIKVRAAENRQTMRQYILSLLEKDGISIGD